MPKCNFNKLQSNFIKLALQYECSPVNLPHIFRTPFPKSTYGQMLLQGAFKRCCSVSTFMLFHSSLFLKLVYNFEISCQEDEFTLKVEFTL